MRRLLWACAVVTAPSACAEPFSVAPSYPADLRPVAVTLGDFNGDTKVDLAVADSIRHAITVYYWNSTCASWQFHGQYDTARGPRSLSSADFNDDGLDDIVAACADVDSLTLLYSTANFGYSRRDLATLRYPFTVRAADIDADGAPDIAVTHWMPWIRDSFASTGVPWPIPRVSRRLTFPCARAPPDSTLPT